MNSENAPAIPPPLEDWDAEAFTKQEMTTITKFCKTLPPKFRLVNPSELAGLSKAQKKAYLQKFNPNSTYWGSVIETFLPLNKIFS